MTSLFQMLSHLQTENVIQYLQENNLLYPTTDCVCGYRMSIQKYIRVLDKFTYRCAKCKKTKTIKQGRFFKNATVTLSQIMQMALLWSFEIPVTAVSELISVSEKTAIQWFNYCRDICSFKMVSLNQLLGGEGRIVQIDESLMFRRKNNVGRLVEQLWVFGMYDLSIRKGYLVHVSDRSANTLIPIIQRWIIPGTTIHSDEWAAYNTLAQVGYDHHVVNHSRNFVDPTTGATTNHVEAFWSRIKRRLKCISASQGEMRWSHLDEACYRHWFDFTSDNPLRNFGTFVRHMQEFNDS
jgi:hypothetical protein